jgi:tetratricopeptide (TPR) repeat protein
MLLLISADVYSGGKRETGEEEQDIDYLGIAALMVRDGHFDRARAALENVDPSDEGVDKTQYYTLQGLLAFRDADFKNAVRSLERAIQHGQDKPVVNVYLAQAYYGAGEYKKAIKTVQKADAVSRFPELLGIQSQSHWMLKETVEAFRVIDKAVQDYPGKLQFRQQRIFYLIELGLYQEAVDQSRRYLEAAGDDPNAYLIIGEALRRGGKYEQAVLAFETAVLIHPGNQKLREALAQAYSSNDQPAAAARVALQAGVNNNTRYYRAADFFRQAGETNRAFYCNSLVEDQNLRVRQKFQLLVEQRRYEEALAMEESLGRIGALDDDGMKYAIAYLYYTLGKYGEAQKYLNRIANPAFNSTVSQLRRVIETARE